MKLIVGHIDKDLTKIILDLYPSALLINEDNLSTSFKIGYTGIEEFSNKEKFLELLLSAEEIFYYPNYSSESYNFYNILGTSRGLTEYFLRLAEQDSIKINRFNFLGEEKVSSDFENLLELADSRKSNLGPQLWCFGCSFTAGVGVDAEQSYPFILSKKINLPLNLLAKEGSSIFWASDQILRSDIRKNDIIVWGLTGKNRLPYVKDNKINIFTVHNPIENFTEKALSQLLIDEDFLSYIQLSNINQVVNFCEKVGANLLLVGLLTSPSDFLYLRKIKNYYHYHYKNNKYIDFGSDGGHPGPIQHQQFANKIENILILKGLINGHDPAKIIV